MTRVASSPELMTRTLQQPTHYRVPRGDQQYLFAPPLNETLSALEQNARLLSSPETLLWGFPLAEWRKQAKAQTLPLALEYTREIIGQEISEIDPAAPIIMTGHQPELFHPGVWIKNLLIDRLAERVQGVSVNIIVDSDTLKSRAIYIPSRVAGQLMQKRIEVDDWPANRPWQEVKATHRDKLNSFPQRVEQDLLPLAEESVLNQFWQGVLETDRIESDMVSGLVAGRQQMERSLGIRNLELPLSRLIQTDSFCQFMAKLLQQSLDFRQAYNASLKRYRQLYQLKSESHPMPDLQEIDGWCEVPFWVWSAADTRRKPLFVRALSDGGMELADQDRWQVMLAPEQMCQQLRGLMQDGIRIRTRALITTLYLRLFLADWFVHGIGGAKYDEITDDLMANWFEVEPPVYQVATGTIFLPLEKTYQSSGPTVAAVQQQIRNGEENPETLLFEPYPAEVRELLEEKQELIAAQEAAQTSGLSRRERRARRTQNKQRYHRFEENRAALRRFAEPELEELQQQLIRVEQAAADRVVVQGREYPVCLYPESSLISLRDEIENRLPDRPASNEPHFSGA